MNNETIDYYNNNAVKFATGTINVDMSTIQNKFLSYLKNEGRILDLGCGAGRDTKYFMSKGYSVEAVDGSEELCKMASEYTGIKVRHLYFENLDYENEFDGIWACSSLLHVPSAELKNVLQRCFKAMKKDGVFYLSFKEGSNEGLRNGRYFTDLTAEKITALLSEIGYDNKVEELFITQDARPDRDLKWVNVIVRKN